MDQNTPQAPLDYLNSIAPTPQRKMLSPFLLWGIIGVAIALVIIIFMALTSFGGTSKPDLTTFAARLEALQTVSTEAKNDLQTSELRSLNSSLTLVLTNANRDIADILTDADITLNEKNTQFKEVATETTKLTDALEDARLNGVYDRTYTREIVYYLKTLRNQISVLYSSARSESLKKFLNETNDNLKPLQESFSALTTA
ncbi:hypothetical protein RAAC3_TM7C00001G0391 [Candidatus Saccharibacteria bacterium RAAC3_TM7_1]|nr:hypothetical protein RAAC3_TM7C00001G0391 [Candidatus Saccharibacteria bacterium RAAC3_TM7_1]HCZ28723.1 hypothetical protein [Candidatus Saccharibacteria bacterium]